MVIAAPDTLATRTRVVSLVPKISHEHSIDSGAVQYAEFIPTVRA